MQFFIFIWYDFSIHRFWCLEPCLLLPTLQLLKTNKSFMKVYRFLTHLIDTLWTLSLFIEVMFTVRKDNMQCLLRFTQFYSSWNYFVFNRYLREAKLLVFLKRVLKSRNNFTKTLKIFQFLIKHIEFLILHRRFHL